MSIEDKAQEHEAAVWSINNRARPGLDVKQPDDPAYGPAECECGEEIPAVRRSYGFKNCVYCATAAERCRC